MASSEQRPITTSHRTDQESELRQVTAGPAVEQLLKYAPERERLRRQRVLPRRTGATVAIVLRVEATCKRKSRNLRAAQPARSRLSTCWLFLRQPCRASERPLRVCLATVQLLLFVCSAVLPVISLAPAGCMTFTTVFDSPPPTRPLTRPPLMQMHTKQHNHRVNTREKVTW